MKILSVLQQEEENTNSMVFYKNKQQYVLYERSAFLFTKHVFRYSPEIEFCPQVAKKVLFLSLSQKSLEKVLKKLSSQGKEIFQEKNKIIVSQYDISEEEFLHWRNGYWFLHPKEKDYILQKIVKYPLNKKNIVDVFCFVDTIQKTIRSFQNI